MKKLLDAFRVSWRNSWHRKDGFRVHRKWIRGSAGCAESRVVVVGLVRIKKEATAKAMIVSFRKFDMSEKRRIPP